MVLNYIRNLYNYKVSGNPLVKEFSAYSLSTIIFHGSRIMTELLVAKLVGPKLFGIWYLLNLLLTYRSVTNLGVVNGMLLKIPILRGKKEQKDADGYKNVAFLVINLAALLTSMVLLGFVYLDFGEYTDYLYPLILLVFTSQYYYFIDALFISYGNFNNISKMQTLCALCFPCLSIPLVYAFGLSGFIIGTSLAYLIAVLVIYFKFDLSIRLRFHLTTFKQLVQTGFPIMLVGVIYTFFITIDRWMIEIMLGAEDLGIFSMAILTFGMLTILPATIARQFHPKMAYDWGRTQSKAILKDWIKKQGRYCFYTLLTTIVAVLAVFPLFLLYWLPQYSASIIPIVIISLGTLSISASAGWGDIMNILGRQKVYIVISVVFIGVNILLTYTFIISGFGIIGVASATTIAFVLFNLTLRFTAQRILTYG